MRALYTRLSQGTLCRDQGWERASDRSDAVATSLLAYPIAGFAALLPNQTEQSSAWPVESHCSPTGHYCAVVSEQNQARDHLRKCGQQKPKARWTDEALAWDCHPAYVRLRLRECGLPCRFAGSRKAECRESPWPAARRLGYPAFRRLCAPGQATPGRNSSGAPYPRIWMSG